MQRATATLVNAWAMESDEFLQADETQMITPQKKLPSSSSSDHYLIDRLRSEVTKERAGMGQRFFFLNVYCVRSWQKGI